LAEDKFAKPEINAPLAAGATTGGLSSCAQTGRPASSSKPKQSELSIVFIMKLEISKNTESSLNLEIAAK
jgi:hypothetical protein